MAKRPTKAKPATDVAVARKVLDEVPRLRAEVKALKAEVDKANSTSVRLSRENRKLKEAAKAKPGRTRSKSPPGEARQATTNAAAPKGKRPS